MYLAVLLAVTAGGLSAAGDKNQPVTQGRDRAAVADRAGKEGDVTYGRIKEFRPGKQIVIDVDNAIDKSFELAEKDQRINVAAGLKTGDPVKVTERDVDGKKTVHIVKHTGGNVQHGDPKSTAGADRAERDADVTYGRIKELTPGGKVVIDVDNALDKSFKLAGDDHRVHLASDLKVGDPVKVTEREVDGKKRVEIVKHMDPNVPHGDRDTKTRKP